MLLLDWTFMWKRVFWKFLVCLHFLIFYRYSTFCSFWIWPKWKYVLFSTLNDVSWTNEQNKTIKFDGKSFVYSTGAKNRSKYQNWAGWAKLSKHWKNFLVFDIWSDLMLILFWSDQRVQRYKQLRFSSHPWSFVTIGWVKNLLWRKYTYMGVKKVGSSRRKQWSQFCFDQTQFLVSVLLTGKAQLLVSLVSLVGPK